MWSIISSILGPTIKYLIAQIFAQLEDRHTINTKESEEYVEAPKSRPLFARRRDIHSDADFV